MSILYCDSQNSFFERSAQYAEISSLHNEAVSILLSFYSILLSILMNDLVKKKKKRMEKKDEADEPLLKKKVLLCNVRHNCRLRWTQHQVLPGSNAPDPPNKHTLLEDIYIWRLLYLYTTSIYLQHLSMFYNVLSSGPRIYIYDAVGVEHWVGHKLCPI